MWNFRHMQHILGLQQQNQEVKWEGLVVNNRETNEENCEKRIHEKSFEFEDEAIIE